MDLRNFGQLKGRVLSLKENEDGSVWFVVSVINANRKDDNGQYTYDNFPLTAYDKLAKYIKDFVVVGQLVTVGIRLVSKMVSYQREGQSHKRSQLLLKATQIVTDEPKAVVLERQSKKEQVSHLENVNEHVFEELQFMDEYGVE